MKLIYVLVLILLIPISFLFAQTVKTDSASIKTKIAVADVKQFKVTKQAWKAYKNHQVIFSSDYFKPTTINTTHPELLTDSTYVKAFKEAAYQKITKRRTAGHYVFVGGVIAVAVSIAILVAGVAALSFGG